MTTFIEIRSLLKLSVTALTVLIFFDSNLFFDGNRSQDRGYLIRTSILEKSRHNLLNPYPYLDNEIHNQTVSMFSYLPSLRYLAKDSVRFVALPSCSTKKFALYISKNGDGMFVEIVEGKAQSDKIVNKERFRIPISVAKYILNEFDKFVLEDYDRLSQPKSNEKFFSVDGTDVTFERTITGAFYNGGTSSRGGPPIEATVRNQLAPYVPKLRAVSEDWIPPSEGC